MKKVLMAVVVLSAFAGTSAHAIKQLSNGCLQLDNGGIDCTKNHVSQTQARESKVLSNGCIQMGDGSIDCRGVKQAQPSN